MGLNEIRATPAKIIGEHFSKFYPEADILAKKPERELEEAIENGRYEEEGWRLRKDGTRFWANVVITPVRDKTGRLIGFAKVTRNLTERKQAEDELRAAYADLENRITERTEELLVAKTAAEKAVVSRDQFFSIASHELKTPITAMKLQVQIRKRNVTKGNFSEFAPERLLQLCADDERQVERLTFLVNNMLDIAKLNSRSISLTLEPISLNDLVADAVSRLGPMFKDAGIAVKVQSLEKIEGCWDKHRIEQVLTNLLSNTIKYARGKPVEIDLSLKSKQVTITILDQGIGIREDQHHRIFNPFERVTATSEITSLGLGLFVVRQIVEAHGGSISVDSRLHEGAKFTVLLPQFIHSENESSDA